MYVRIRFCIFLWCFLRKKRCTTTGPQGGKRGETHLFEQRNLNIPHARGKDNCDDYFAVLLLCSHYFTPLFSSTERSKDLVRPKAIRFCQLQCSGPTILRYQASSLISVSNPSLSHSPPSSSLARLISRLSTACLQSI